MRNPEKVLNSLAKHSGNSNYKFERLYKVLFNEEMYYTAYQNIYHKVGNMTAGVDGKTIDGMSIHRIEQLISTLRNETYQPNPSRREYIPKKNGKKKRPLGIPSFDDKLVQEVIRMILEAIYEGSFEHTSHGFRPKRSCHTALLGVQQSFTAVRWFIEGDIKGFFDNINHEVLIGILKERIADERFIRLIRKFLNAGYVEDWVFRRTYSGTPQGGIISPVLANIYLDKFDKYVKEYIKSFNKGETKRVTRGYGLNEQRRGRLAKKLSEEKDEQVKKQMIVKIKDLIKERSKYPAYKKVDDGYKRMKYMRYADDFLIGVIGSKEDCIKMKQDIKDYLNEKLKLELSEEKTLITNAKKPAKFLGYDIFVRQSNDTKRDKFGRPVRCFGDKIVLYVTAEVMRKKLTDYKAVTMEVQNGKEVWKPIPRYYMVNLDELEIIQQYNSEIRGFYNYYSIANNASLVQSFSYIMEYSMYKSYAAKNNSSIAKEKTSKCINGVFTIPYKNKDGKTVYRRFYKDGFKRKKIACGANVDNIPETVTTTGGRNSLMKRLKAEICEKCGATEKLEMHHVRKLKDLKGKTEWEKIMVARRRKTLAVCSKCHDKIHAGKLD
ncbi:reverse transcriptase domain-containing protein [Arcticibacter tournemirensis]|uniref:Group II intron reverse transcriptase/maturase n=1 Tax=Arcticibacter tournemirensis TaxID=699437 RepID=A0A4V1KIF9_9SPHI|nr:reverse transcriptase domain-containing protein [Arcticibacter tournemirensis]RXF70552.1 group II intron reverse transcriptase/maturase [Arcticibacter tournemirensis]